MKISSFARPLPTRRGRRCVPPKPGRIPRPVSGWPNLALSDATRMSHAIEISQPPPRAYPLTAAIVTWGIVSSFKKASLARRPIFLPSAGVAFTISEISAPATKAFVPEPVRITTLISLRSAISPKHWSSSASVSLFNAFSDFGLLIVTTATSFSTSINKLFIKHPPKLMIHN